MYAIRSYYEIAADDLFRMADVYLSTEHPPDMPVSEWMKMTPDYERMKRSGFMIERERQEIEKNGDFVRLKERETQDENVPSVNTTPAYGGGEDDDMELGDQPEDDPPQQSYNFV